MADKKNVNDYISVVCRGERRIFFCLKIVLVIGASEIVGTRILYNAYGFNKPVQLVILAELLISAAALLVFVNMINKVHAGDLERNLKDYNLLPGSDDLSDDVRSNKLEIDAKKSFDRDESFQTSSISISGKYVLGKFYDSITTQLFIIPVEKIECVNYLYQPNPFFHSSVEDMIIEVYIVGGYYITMFVKEVTIGSREDMAKINSILNVRTLGC